MKAMMLWEPERLELVDLPDEAPGPGEVLLRVDACSVCGSDLEGYHGIHPKVTWPRVMGHECACTVAALGPGVTGIAVGDRLAGTGAKACGECGPCRGGDRSRCERPGGPGFTAHGAYAQWMTVLPRDLTPIPECISDEEAAVAQPICIANHAVATRAAVRAGETVLVQGCGPIGLAAMILSRRRGARVVSTDIVDYRCRRARDLGADLALNAHADDVLGAVKDLTGGRGADKVIECVGGDQDETLAQAVRAVRPGGLIAVVGSFANDRATVPIIDLKFNEKRILGSQSMPEGYEPVFALIRSGEVPARALITHRLPLAETRRALRLMDEKAEEVMKVVIFPNSGKGVGA
ncbi:MAG: alcohol dehydrogenase catalytic domain-containing protein [Armatimonadetes bacterium]|nr:alcohol dehydrogenase catalytic domain-containing protein [Armatimonadota bacterium]